MPPLPAVPKCIQFKLFFNDNGNSNVQMLLYFTYTGTLAQADLQALCNQLQTQWNTHMGPQICATCSLLGVTGNDLSSSLAPKSASTGAAQAGGLANPELSSGAAFVISHETARKYRGGHSRSYIPGQAQQHLADGNTWTAAVQSAMLTAWNAFVTSFITTAVPVAVGTLQQVVAHRYGRSATAPVLSAGTESPSVPLANPFTDPVTASIANPQVGSQRRRNQQAG